LPQPPAAAASYGAWFRALPRAARARVDRFCRAHPDEPEARCGGIGPLHIPPPPSSVATEERNLAAGFAWPTRDAWFASLSAAQRGYVEDHCAIEDNAYSRLCGATPIVIAFDDAPVAYARGGRFAFRPGDPVTTDWPTAATPWLARDLDGDGAITSGRELFGGDTVLANDGTGASGFDALDELDANGDRVLDARDPAFATLVLWADDGDRVSQPHELRRLDAVVRSIALDDAIAPRCDGRGNCERERATLTWVDGEGMHAGAAIDVHLRIRD